MKSNNYIDSLVEIGAKFECELLLPPFNGTNNVFYQINDLKNDAVVFRNFMLELGAIKAKFDYIKIDEKMFIEIEMNEETIEGVEYVV